MKLLETLIIEYGTQCESTWITWITRINEGAALWLTIATVILFLIVSGSDATAINPAETLGYGGCPRSLGAPITTPAWALQIPRN